MKVVSLEIENFRGVRSAKILLDGHTLLIGANNVGKSTICEALDLVLGADRLNRQSPIDEFDFYNARYMERQAADEPPKLVEIRIEATLVEFGDEVGDRCGGHTEFWHVKEKRLLGAGEIDQANAPNAVRCLRIVTVGRYDPEEDEFRAETFFSHSPERPEGELASLPRPIKRAFGFLYLRTLRTGARALSLERGSLLDIILRTKGGGARTQLWEETIEQLRKFDVESSAAEIAPILRKVEKRLGRYVALDSPGSATKLHVSDLTREHLRKTLSFFLALSADQSHVPFPHAGTGTIGTLILAMLSLIADLKPSTVIFAMEEPEIALPPHTQRRIANYLKTKSTQAFVTSHSPFVIEQFDPSQTILLSREGGVVSGKRVSEATGLKENDFKRFARWGLSECMLGKIAIVVEGITEFHALPVIARRMEDRNENLQPLDIAGAAFFNADGDGNGPKFGQFFKTLGLCSVAFHDTNPKHSDVKIAEYAKAFDIDFKHQEKGFEQLMVNEVPADRLWEFLQEIKDGGESGNVGIPAEKPDEKTIRDTALKAFRSGKGAGWAARLFEMCSFEELPPTVIKFLDQVYELSPTRDALDADDDADSDAGTDAPSPGPDPGPGPGPGPGVSLTGKQSPEAPTGASSSSANAKAGANHPDATKSWAELLDIKPLSPEEEAEMSRSESARRARSPSAKKAEPPQTPPPWPSAFDGGDE